MPFVKSSFAHYQKCPRSMNINGKIYKDLVLTMEIIQAPKPLSYFKLDDPKVVLDKLKAKRAADRKIMIEAKKQEMKEAKMALAE
jgi:hypothetical protein